MNVDEHLVLPELPRDAHKGIAGRVVLACGSAWMPGAAVLASRAAQRAGAGLVTLWCRDVELVAIVAATAPETVFVPRERDVFEASKQHAALVGPGLGLDAIAHDAVEHALKHFDGPLVLDADALTLLARAPELARTRNAPLVLTPHPLEAARLLGRELASDHDARVAAAREIGMRYRAICCLKGSRSIVTDGERVAVNTTGNAGMATAGAGDVLAGIAVAYLAQTRSLPNASWTPLDALRAAVHVHGLAGDLAAAELGERALVAGELVAFLGRAQRSLGAR